MAVRVEFTPNPKTIKYCLDRRLIDGQPRQFVVAEEAVGRSPLAQRLFALSDVRQVLLGGDFVTVTMERLKSHEQVTDLNRSVVQVIREHLESGEPALRALTKDEEDEVGDGDEIDGAEVSSDEAILGKIRSIFDTEIRPAVALDGGDITVERYDDRVLYLRMKGSCQGCPSASATLRFAVQDRLKRELPDLEAIEAL